MFMGVDKNESEVQKHQQLSSTILSFSYKLIHPYKNSNKCYGFFFFDCYVLMFVSVGNIKISNNFFVLKIFSLLDARSHTQRVYFKYMNKILN